ncbi:hypothetical protein [Actinomadura harenae]|uniref:Uncharacterized protein n=1 Tax=Actinomadura harenae TaxID=2483351 RepID=A0A3M2LPK0_9ACTN|nr:hypothetical protein [Actinomadura harenae]RMI38463.1 hypothetical protein EBO15_32825 [Actinomadura harenae]
MTEPSMIRRSTPISDEAAARLVSDAAFEELAADITRTARTARAARRPRVRPRFALALGAVAAVVAIVIGWTGGQRSAEALNFSRNGQYVDVTLRDPKADPARLRAEFAEHRMPVELEIWPASPSLVGAMLSWPEDPKNVKPAEIRWKDCGGIGCRSGVRIPVDLRTPVTVLFGRAPNPGERIRLTGDATAPGEILAGVPVVDRTVAEVVTALRQRHGTVEIYNLDRPADATTEGWDISAHVVPANKVKGTWRVTFVSSGHTSGAVGLVVSKTDVRPGSE